VFVHFNENNVQRGTVKKVVELLLCWPGSSASIERVFAHMNYIWSEKMSQFHVYKIQAMLALKSNTDSSYETFNGKLASNPGILKKIGRPTVFR
jgi:hypothetical protein